MAGLTLTPIEGGRSRGARKPLAEIDESVKITIEEAIGYFEDHDGRLETESFTSSEVADNWLRDARAYAYQRDPRVVVSGNPARAKGNSKTDGSGPYVVRFSVEAYAAPAAEGEPAAE